MYSCQQGFANRVRFISICLKYIHCPLAWCSLAAQFYSEYVLYTRFYARSCVSCMLQQKLPGVTWVIGKC